MKTEFDLHDDWPTIKMWLCMGIPLECSHPSLRKWAKFNPGFWSGHHDIPQNYGYKVRIKHND